MHFKYNLNIRGDHYSRKVPYSTPWSGFMGFWNMGAKFVCPLKIGGKFTSQELIGNVSWQFISHELTFPEIMILGNSYSRVRAYFKT